MPGRDTQYEALAREAAERLSQDREVQRQLSLLPDEREGSELVDQDGGDGKRGKGKALSQMREFLAAKGYRLPEEVLAEMAGLTSGLDAVGNAMSQAERVLSWAESGATSVKGEPAVQTLRRRLDVFQQLLVVQLRAADALMPYGAPKASPDVSVNQVTNFIVPAQPSGAAEGRMRDISPVSDRRMLPADVRWKMQQDQDVMDADPDASDGEGRTE